MKRDFEVKIHKFKDKISSESAVLLVDGARQVGKTYLIEAALKQSEHKIIINLEKEPLFKSRIDETKSFEEFTELLKLQKGFKNNSSQILFFDEAQESEKLGFYVRQMKEDFIRTGTILTGSSMNKLFNGTQRVPVGRFRYLTVYPFSFREFLRFGEKEEVLDSACSYYSKSTEIPDFIHSELLNLYDSFLLVGGMPEAVKAFFSGGDYQEVLGNIVASQKDDFLRKERVKTYLF